jgi:hypothetical protein
LILHQGVRNTKTESSLATIGIWFDNG